MLNVYILPFTTFTHVGLTFSNISRKDSAVLKWFLFNSTALRKAKIVYNFGLSGCNRVKIPPNIAVLF